MFDFSLMKKLSEANSPSGYEKEIKSIIYDEIKDFADNIYYDKMGNLIAIKGKSPEILYSAHIDEVGFMAKGFTDDGYVIADNIGGINSDPLISKRIRFENGNKGIFLAVPVHFSDSKDAKKLSTADILIDIGAKSKSEAENIISIGDAAVFDTEFSYLDINKEYICGKALDNRIGVYILIQLMKSGKIDNAYFVFNVQEETGLRGASVIAGSLDFKIGVAVDTTTAFDVPDAENMLSVAKCGSGAVISYADGRTVYDNKLVSSIFEHLENKNIKCQTKTFCSGGNDASSIQKAGKGHIAISISTPARNIHSPIASAAISDIESMINTAYEIYQMNSEGKI